MLQQNSADDAYHPCLLTPLCQTHPPCLAVSGNHFQHLQRFCLCVLCRTDQLGLIHSRQHDLSCNLPDNGLGKHATRSCRTCWVNIQAVHARCVQMLSNARCECRLGHAVAINYQTPTPLDSCCTSRSKSTDHSHHCRNAHQEKTVH